VVRDDEILEYLCDLITRARGEDLPGVSGSLLRNELTSILGHLTYDESGTGDERLRDWHFLGFEDPTL
jgi:hypothetical protein